MKYLKTKLAAMFFAVLAVFASPLVFAADPDYTAMTSSVSFTGVITAFLAIGGILMAMYVVWKGVKLVISMLKGG